MCPAASYCKDGSDDFQDLYMQEARSPYILVLPRIVNMNLLGFNNIKIEVELRNPLILGVPGWIRWLSIQLLISAQVVISWFMGLSPTLGSVLTVQSLVEIFPLSVSPLLTVSLLFSKK